MIKYIQTNRRRFIEESLTLCFSVNIAEFFYTYFEEHLPAAASEFALKL